MIQIDLPTLVKRLNLFSRQALEMAASECMSQRGSGNYRQPCAYSDARHATQ